VHIDEGTYTIEFSTETGYYTPAPITVTLDNDKVESATYAIIPVYEVTINDIAGIAGGQVQVDSGPFEDLPFTTNLYEGPHQFRFKDVNGYYTPG
jgi:hypothetical protein